MTGYPEPNYTETPNALFDIDMAIMGDAELRVTLTVIRKTLGYHKHKPEPISLTQIQKMSGLSRQGAIDGVEAALKRGRIKRAGTGDRGVHKYLVNFSDQSTDNTSTSQASRPEPVKPVDTQKKKKENSKEKNIAPKAQRQPDPLFNALAEYIFDAPPGSETVNAVGGRVGTLERWCKGGDITRTRDGRKQTLPGCTFDVIPGHVAQFAQDWKRSKPSANIPRDVFRFAEHFLAWLEKRMNKPAPYTPPPLPEYSPDEITARIPGGV